MTGDFSITITDVRTTVIYTFLAGPYIQCDVVCRSGRQYYNIELDTDPNRVSWSRSAFYALFISVAESQVESKYIRTHYNRMRPVHNIVFTPVLKYNTGDRNIDMVGFEKETVRITHVPIEWSSGNNSLLDDLKHDLQQSDAEDMRIPCFKERMKWAKSREGLESMTKELRDMIDRIVEDQTEKWITENKHAIAKNMLNLNISDNDILISTGISESELNTLKSSMS